MTTRLTLQDIEDLALRALTRAATGDVAAGRAGMAALRALAGD